ncbi:hypothetical protein BGZ46_007778 [Entomortierella lignicola]|nr:hypothetical protein BGZ46_007778 [Entomortierella lignicola]
MALALASSLPRPPSMSQQPEIPDNYPYLPPPGIYSSGSDHPLQTRSFDNRQTKTHRIIEIFFHGIQAIVSTYALLNIISTVHFQLVHEYISGTAWTLLFASAVSTLMALWYCMLAWHADTTGAKSEEDIEKALETRQNIGYSREREARSKKLENTHKRDGALRCCFEFLISPRPRVWVLISLISLTLMSSVLQGYRIRKGFNCRQYTEIYRGFCETTKAAVISTFLTSLLWFCWFAYWFLTAFCLHRNRSYRSELLDEDIIDGLAMGEDAGETMVVTQADHPTGKQHLEQLSSSQSSLPSCTTIQYLDITESLESPEGDCSILKDLKQSIMSADICTEEPMDPPELLSSKSEDVSVCDMVKESTLSSEIPPCIEGTDFESESSESKVLSSVQSTIRLQESTFPVTLKSKRSVRFLTQGGSNIDTSLKNREAISMRFNTSSTIANQPKTDIPVDPETTPSVTNSRSAPILREHRPQIELTRNHTVSSMEKHRSLQGTLQSRESSHPSYPSRLQPTRSNTTALNATRASMETIQVGFSKRPRSFSMGRITSSRKLQSLLGPLRPASEIEGSSFKVKSRSRTPSFRVIHRHSSALSIASELSLSLEDQQRLRMFREGQLAYPPPPGVSPTTRTSMSFFPDLEEKEKERILNRMSHI